MFNKAEKIFAVAILILGVVVSIVGYSYTAPSDPPKRIWFDTTAGNVIFDHVYHSAFSECSDCHHDYDKESSPLDFEMDCRVCHYFGEKPEEESEDSNHPRFVGAQCFSCHTQMAMEVTCEACHIQQGFAFEASGRVMPTLPIEVVYENDEGKVTFNHKDHMSEDVDEPCLTCHHKIEEDAGLQGLEGEKNCRVCHYELARKIPKLEDENHPRYIGANCTECHDVEDCSVCHEEKGKEQAGKRRFPSS
jgi:hypothetical protein